MHRRGKGLSALHCVTHAHNVSGDFGAWGKQVKVFWGLDAPGLQDVDNGTFHKWLSKTEEELQQGRDPCLVGSCQSQVSSEPHCSENEVDPSMHAAS